MKIDKRRIRTTALFVGGCLVYLLIFSYTKIGIPCLFHLATGLQCPGCGGTRMCANLLQGRFALACGYNPYLFFTAPIYLYLCGRIWICWIQGATVRWRKWENVIIYILLGTAVIFGILRNLS